MSPQLEALAMLNNMFESHDGRPVDNAVLTRADYGFLIRALTDKPTSETPKTEARPVTMAGFVPIPENTPYMNALLKGEQIERERNEAQDEASKQYGRRLEEAQRADNAELRVKALEAKLAAARPDASVITRVRMHQASYGELENELSRIEGATKP